MYIGLHVKCRYYCQILAKLEYSRQIIEKYSNIEFHENVPCGGGPSCSVWADGRTDMTKLIVAFRNFAESD